MMSWCILDLMTVLRYLTFPQIAQSLQLSLFADYLAKWMHSDDKIQVLFMHRKRSKKSNLFKLTEAQSMNLSEWETMRKINLIFSAFSSENFKRISRKVFLQEHKEDELCSSARRVASSSPQRFSRNFKVFHSHDESYSISKQSCSAFLELVATNCDC